MGGDHQMFNMEDPFDHSEWPFNKRSDSADCAISALLPDGQWITPEGSSHGFILCDGKWSLPSARDRPDCHAPTQLSYQIVG